MTGHRVICKGVELSI